MASVLTIVESIGAATAQLKELRGKNLGAPAREFSLALTHLEDAQMRATRGLAMLEGVFAPADLQSQAVQVADAGRRPAVRGSAEVAAAFACVPEAGKCRCGAVTQ